MTIIDELRLWSDQSGSLLGDAAADEIVRLRTALEEIERQAPEYSDFYWAGDIARRALEGK